MKVKENIQVCGKTCDKCSLLSICGGCNGARSRDCLVGTCLSRGVQVKDLTMNCETCAYDLCCPKSDFYSIPNKQMMKKLDLILDSWDRIPATLELPKFIPEVPLENHFRCGWRKLDVEALLATFSNPEGEQIDRVKEDGVHNYLDFDGTILLSTILPDEILMSDRAFDSTLVLLKKGRFDGVVGWDMPVYSDAPKARSLTNLVGAALYTLKLAKEGIPTIPLFKGSDEKEMDLDMQWLRTLGFRQVALHATEYVLSKGDDQARELMGMALTKIRELGADPLIIGMASPRSLTYDFYKAIPEASYAGMSWSIDARRYLAYHGTDVLDLKMGVMECGCSACSGKLASQVSSRVADIAEHNLVQLNTLLGGEQIEEMKYFDLAVERGLIAIVCDPHVGTPQSLWERCIESLEEIRPAYLILLGDIFDYIHGNPTSWEVTTFMKGLRNLGAEVIPVLGCSDSNPMKLMEAMQSVLFKEEPVRPQLPNPSRIRSDAARDLLAIYAASKEKLTVKLADDRIAIFEHGHNLRVDRNADSERIVTAILSRKGAPEIAYVIGHYHRSFFDRKTGIAMLGSWQTQTHEEEKMGLVPDTMDVLLIDEDGSMELQKGS